MIFQSKDFYVDLVENENINEIAQVYNSNKHFLLSHIDSGKVTYEWVKQELESMDRADFYSCKVVEKITGKIIGIVDFKAGKEAYLSLLMLHKDYKDKGYGKLIYQALEEYVKSIGSKCIRIDVVTDYDESVLNFWTRKGFIKFKDVELNWTGRILPAVTMKKKI
ncbi:GNAT family N-acetyltransferase [Lutispora saccharofermentans]|uniref:GNAT family N-acetyltransferase n=1 Tax=Lutispora saccharofermentans TaxID=3024236 RepID=A0ABT1NFE1_9FIRM|nr:GNAT family N-acetyltransferase [Lutispora saccharofermentans]MCQ1529970.1 GNAT family N-acetyltransferase [Lutispora saccharofermentans]